MHSSLVDCLFDLLLFTCEYMGLCILVERSLFIYWNINAINIINCVYKIYVIKMDNIYRKLIGNVVNRFIWLYYKYI